MINEVRDPIECDSFKACRSKGHPHYTDGTHLNDAGVMEVIPMVNRIAAVYGVETVLVSDSCLGAVDSTTGPSMINMSGTACRRQEGGDGESVSRGGEELH